MAGLALGLGIHFLPIFLIFKYDCDVVCEGEEGGVGEEEHLTGPGVKDDAAHMDPFCCARFCGFCVLTGTHGKEECA
jgi:hypothetical protein